MVSRCRGGTLEANFTELCTLSGSWQSTEAFRSNNTLKERKRETRFPSFGMSFARIDRRKPLCQIMKGSVIYVLASSHLPLPSTSSRNDAPPSRNPAASPALPKATPKKHACFWLSTTRKERRLPLCVLKVAQSLSSAPWALFHWSSALFHWSPSGQLPAAKPLKA